MPRLQQGNKKRTASLSKEHGIKMKGTGWVLQQSN